MRGKRKSVRSGADGVDAKIRAVFGVQKLRNARTIGKLAPRGAFGGAWIGGRNRHHPIKALHERVCDHPHRDASALPLNDVLAVHVHQLLGVVRMQIVGIDETVGHREHVAFEGVHTISLPRVVGFGMGNRRRVVESFHGQDLALLAAARAGGGGVVRTELALPLSFWQSQVGGTINSSVFPTILGGDQIWTAENAYLVGADILVQEQFAAPGLSAADAQVLINAPDPIGLTGVANIFTGGTGYTAPPPDTLQLLIGFPKIPQSLVTITGATFDQLTAGSLLFTLLYSILPSPP